MPLASEKRCPKNVRFRDGFFAKVEMRHKLWREGEVLKNSEDHEMSVANVCNELEAIDEVLRKELPSYKERLDEGDILQDEEEAQLLRLSFELMAAECSTYDLCMADERYSGLLEQIEMKLRGLRESANRMWATSVEKKIMRDLKQAKDYGVEVQFIDGGLSFRLPYQMACLSDLFVLRSKKLSGLSSLTSVRRFWSLLVESALRTVDVTSLEGPFWAADVDVTIRIVHARPLDPDHFWIRPILDALVQQNIFVNDDALRMNFSLTYLTKQSTEEIFLDVKKRKKNVKIQEC